MNTKNWKLIFLTITLLLSLVSCQISSRTATAKTPQIPCKSGVIVQEDGKTPVCQPSNTNEPNAVTLYATYHFGANKEFENLATAAQSARANLGNRPTNVYCDQKVWKTSLDDLILALNRDTVFGMPRNQFCQNGGYIEIWPAQ